MHREKTIARIVLVLSIVHGALAAPALVRERYLDVAKDATAASEKRSLDGDSPHPGTLQLRDDPPPALGTLQTRYDSPGKLGTTPPQDNPLPASGTPQLLNDPPPTSGAPSLQNDPSPAPGDPQLHNDPPAGSGTPQVHNNPPPTSGNPPPSPESGNPQLHNDPTPSTLGAPHVHDDSSQGSRKSVDSDRWLSNLQWSPDESQQATNSEANKFLTDARKKKLKVYGSLYGGILVVGGLIYGATRLVNWATGSKPSERRDLASSDIIGRGSSMHSRSPKKPVSRALANLRTRNEDLQLLRFLTSRALERLD